MKNKLTLSILFALSSFAMVSPSTPNNTTQNSVVNKNDDDDNNVPMVAKVLFTSAVLACAVHKPEMTALALGYSAVFFYMVKK